MSRRHFHFTLGPVQSFVAQARRTRDFWAGSFLLSWLSGAALRTVEKLGGTIVFPCVDPDFLGWLEGRRQGEPPRQGVAPNRFLAAVPEGFDPEQVPAAVRTAWKALAEAVWRTDLEVVCGPAQRAIWERQIEGLWEIQWVVTEGAEDTSALDRRKSWRSHLLPEEPGIKCMVMEGWQELSGVASPRLAEPLRSFWRQLRESLPCWRHDLADGEHLCAPAFIKRRFAHVFARLEVPMPGGWGLHGWRLESGVPSVAYMAAARWLARVLEEEPLEALEELLAAAEETGVGYGEWQTDLACIRHAYERRAASVRRLKALDGGVFFRSVLENERLYPAEKTRRMLAALDGLEITGGPSPFYAVLLMDGDRLGQHLRDPAQRERLSTALGEFTREVTPRVDACNGFLVYAGGDDVLALLPLDDALECATRLRALYRDTFEAKGIASTISAAVVFAHFKTPLTRVLADAHELLDAVAKDQRGRDALAVRVLKPGGCVLEWAMPWEKALAEGRLKLERLRASFEELEKGEPSFSSKFFFKLRDRFELLNPTEDQAAVLDAEQARALLAADYLASGRNHEREPDRPLDRARAEAEIALLLEQCRPVERHDNGARWSTSPRLEKDGALLVRFLAQKGAER